MNREEVLAKLSVVFKEFFDDDTISISENTTADDIEEWDSFEHVNLMVTVEDEFGIDIPMGRIVKMKNVGELIDIIMEQI